MHPSHRCFSLSNVNFKKTFKKKKRCSYHQEIPRELGTRCQEWGPETNYVYYVPWDKVGEAWIGGRKEFWRGREKESWRRWHLESHIQKQGDRWTDRPGQLRGEGLSEGLGALEVPRPEPGREQMDNFL